MSTLNVSFHGEKEKCQFFIVEEVASLPGAMVTLQYCTLQLIVHISWMTGIQINVVLFCFFLISPCKHNHNMFTWRTRKITFDLKKGIQTTVLCITFFQKMQIIPIFMWK